MKHVTLACGVGLLDTIYCTNALVPVICQGGRDDYYYYALSVFPAKLGNRYQTRDISLSIQPSLGFQQP